MGTEIGPLQSRDVLLSKSRKKVKRPAQFQVVLLNDDYTPMEFVVMVLQTFFYMNFEKAVVTMLKVHREGRAVCGIFRKEIAETKVATVNRYARQHEYPLLCTMEPV